MNNDTGADESYLLALSALNTLRFAAREIEDDATSHTLIEHAAEVERALNDDYRRDRKPSLRVLQALFLLVRDYVGPLARDEYFGSRYREILQPLSAAIQARLAALDEKRPEMQRP